MYIFLLLAAFSSPVKVSHTYSISEHDIGIRLNIDIQEGYIVPLSDNDCVESIAIYIDNHRLSSDAMLVKGYITDKGQNCPVPMYQRRMSIEFNFISPKRHTSIRVEIYPYINGVKGKKITYKFRTDGKTGKTKGVS